MNDKAKEQRNAYMKEWRKKNKDKEKITMQKYWERKSDNMQNKDLIFRNNVENLLIAVHQNVDGGLAPIDEIKETVDSVGIETIRTLFTDKQVKFLLESVTREEE